MHPRSLTLLLDGLRAAPGMTAFLLANSPSVRRLASQPPEAVRSILGSASSRASFAASVNAERPQTWRDMSALAQQLDPAIWLRDHWAPVSSDEALLAVVEATPPLRDASELRLGVEDHPMLLGATLALLQARLGGHPSGTAVVVTRAYREVALAVALEAAGARGLGVPSGVEAAATAIPSGHATNHAFFLDDAEAERTRVGWW